MHTTITVYQDGKGEWRWRLAARNGRIVADSGEGYRRRVDCYRAVALLPERARWAVVRQQPRVKA